MIEVKHIPMMGTAVSTDFKRVFTQLRTGQYTELTTRNCRGAEMYVVVEREGHTYLCEANEVAYLPSPLGGLVAVPQKEITAKLNEYLGFEMSNGDAGAIIMILNTVRSMYAPAELEVGK